MVHPDVAQPVQQNGPLRTRIILRVRLKAVDASAWRHRLSQADGQKAERDHPKVLVAADHLTRSAEQNYPMFFARATTLQAIHRNVERLFNPDRKDPPRGVF